MTLTHWQNQAKRKRKVNQNKNLEIDLNDISETAIIMVLCHVRDAYSNNPILNDQSAIEVINHLQSLNFTENKKLQRLLKSQRISPFLSQLIVARALYYDRCCARFLDKHPNGNIVNMGCGLDLRYQRIKQTSKSQFIDIDLPKIIDIKNDITAETGNYKMIGQSVFDHSWMRDIISEDVLLLAEGLFMYCNEADIRNLFEEIAQRFPKAEMVCELTHKIYASRLMHIISKPSLQFQYGIGSDAAFKFGVRHSRDLETWHKDILWIKDRSFLEVESHKAPLINVMKYLPLANRQIWTAHYSFG